MSVKSTIYTKETKKKSMSQLAVCTFRNEDRTNSLCIFKNGLYLYLGMERGSEMETESEMKKK